MSHTGMTTKQCAAQASSVPRLPIADTKVVDWKLVVLPSSNRAAQSSVGSTKRCDSVTNFRPELHGSATSLGVTLAQLIKIKPKFLAHRLE